MKNKIIIALLAIATSIFCAIGMVACTVREDESPAHTHTYSSTWSYDEEYHWYKATCEHTNETSSRAKHIFSGEVCSVCGYEKGQDTQNPSAQYTVIFESNGGHFTDGSSLKKTVDANTLLVMPTTPIREGYDFVCWSENVNGTKIWNFNSDKVTSNITLYAIWVQQITITYNANGGKFADNSNSKEQVLSIGSKLNEIEAPKRDGYNFDGWYTSSSLKDLWDFDNDTIQNELTLYAGWTAIAINREVTFVLNFAGAENEVKETENGLITYIPKRAGFVFNGWWYSDGQTDEGYILSRKFDTSEIVTEDGLILYAEWVDEAKVSSQLVAPSVSINQNVFEWSVVAGSTGYNIRVYKSGSNEELINETISKTSWTFPEGYDAGYYNVKIRAAGDGVSTVNSSFVIKSFAHKILSTISNIDFNISTSILTWTEVKNATEYELYVNSQFVETLKHTTFDFSEYEAGTYSIEIAAKKNGYQSSTTSKVVEKKRLKTIENICIFANSKSNGYVLYWDSVSYADTYIVKIGEQELRLNETTYSLENSSTCWDNAETIKLTVQAFDSVADYLISNPSDEITLSKVYSLTIDYNIKNVGETTVEGDVYVPQDYTVSFDLNDGSDRIDSQVVTTTRGIEYPDTPQRSGYIFRGWYIDSDCTQLYNFSQVITANIKLYAGWQKCSVTGNSVEVIDIVSRYNSESDIYKKDTYHASSSNPNYVYFATLTGGLYNLYYRSYTGSKDASIYKEYFYVYNVTKGRVVLQEQYLSSTNWYNLSFEADAGDVFYVRVYAWKKYSGNYSPYYFYFTGAEKPIDGGKANGDKFVGVSQSSLTNVTVPCGQQVTITATTTDDRYIFAGWYNGETCLSEENVYSFTMPSANTAYTARWTCYSVTSEKSIANAGTITEHTDTPIKVGEKVTLTATTNNGYTWLGWYDGDTCLTDELSYTFTMTEKSVTYTANWIECPVTLLKAVKNETSDDAGTVSGVSGATKVGEEVTISATTNDGYTWLGWFDAEGNNVSNGATTYTFVMPSESTVYEAKWTYYTVTTTTNEAQGGTYTTKKAEKVTQEKEVTLTASINNGYTWLGWYDGEILLTNDLNYTFTMQAKDITYTAKWIECPIVLIQTVKDEKSNEAGTVSGVSGATKVGEEVTISATTNDGYTWLGWFDAEGNNVSNGATTYTFVMPSESTVYEAKWTYYTVTTTTNEAHGGAYTTKDAEKVTVGNSVSLSATTNNGYMWMGWYKNADAEPCSLELNYSFTMGEEDVTYYAKWMACPLTISKNIEEAGTISGLSDTTAIGDEITLTATTNEGYTWLGWFFDEDTEPFATEIQCKINLTATSTAVMAKWACYTFTANVNDSLAGSVTSYDNKNITAGQIVTVTATTNAGYTFNGWYNGTELLSSDAIYSFAMPAENISYTAKWDIYTLTVNTVGDGGSVGSAGQYIVSFDLNGATGTAPAQQRITETNGLSYPTIPIRNGYVFAGWYANANCTGNPFDFSAPVDSNVTLYAKWIAHSGNGVLPINGNLSVSVVSKSSSTKSYYAFVPLVSGSISVYSADGLSDTYGYLYDDNKAQITYDDDGGDGNNFKITYNVTAGTLYYVGPYGYSSSGTTTIYSTGNLPSAGGKLVQTPLDCSKPIKITAGESFTVTAKTEYGYTFLGWFRNDETTAFTTDSNCIFTMPKENIVLTAKWTSYTFTSERNDISAGTITDYTDEKITKGKTVSVTAKSNAGYTWLGWYNGDTLLTNELTYTFTMPGENIVYTAKWGCHTLTTETNTSEAGTATIYNNQRIVAGQSITLNSSTNMGYTWLGWYNGDTLLSEDENYSFVMPYESVVYTAKWAYYTLAVNALEGGIVEGIKISAVVNFDLNDGTGIYATQTITAEQGLTYPSVPKRDGYVFRGWFTDNNCTTLFNFSFAITQDVTVYAGWKAMATSNCYSRDFIDVSTSYKSSASAYSFSTAGTSSTSYKYTYFTALTNGTYNIYYKNSSSSTSSSTYIYIYNETRNSIIKSNTYISSTSYTSVSFTANAGDVISIRNYRYSTTYTPTFYLYVTGGSKPVAGGKYNGVNANVKTDGTGVTAGESVTISAQTNNGYIWQGWYNGETLVSTDMTYTFAMPSQDIAYTAKWISYKLTTNKNIDAAGSITEKSAVPIISGESVTITATSNYGYIWQGWYEGSTIVSTDMSYTFSMPSKSIVYTAKWTYYSVTTEKNINAAGSVTYKSDTPTNVGDTVRITADTNNGYTFLGWYNGEEQLTTELTYSFAMPPESIIYTARWVECSVILEKNIDEAGEVSGVEKTVMGKETTITAKSNEGYMFLGWYNGEELLTTELTYSFIMSNDIITYTAKWVECSVTLEKNIDEAGEVSGVEKTVMGKETTITAKSNEGYEFLGWYNGEELLTTELTYSFIMSNDIITYTAKWNYATITLHYIVNGKEIHSQEYTLNNHLESLYNFSETNFNGWYSVENFSTNSVKVTSTTGLNISDNNTYVYGGTYTGTVGLIFTRNGSNYTVNGYTGASTSVTIPTLFNGCSVTDISSIAFRNNTKLTSVIIPNSIETIAGGAFSGCSNLEEVTIPFVGGSRSNSTASASTLFGYIFGSTNYEGGVATSQDYSGSNAIIYYIPSTLHTVNISGGYILRGAFQNCCNIKNVTIGNTISEIGYSAFQNCVDLYNLSIGIGVTLIDWYAFSGCTKLTIVEIPNSVKTINWYAFRNCTGLVSITIGSGVTGIGTCAFQNCYRLVEIVNNSSLNLTEGSDTYGYVAYYARWVDTTSWVFITGEGLIGARASLNTPYIYGYVGTATSLTLPDKLNGTYKYSGIYQYAFYGNKDLQSISIPSCVTSIGEYAFNGCSNLSEITIPSNVNNIGAYAFHGTLWYNNKTDGVIYINKILYSYKGYVSSSKSITVQSGTEAICDFAFKDCEWLTSINVPISVTCMGKGIFSGCRALVSMTIPFVGHWSTTYSTSDYTTRSFGYIFGTSWYSGGAEIITGINGDSRNFYIPATLREVTVLGGTIWHTAFYYCSMLTTINLGSAVTEIGNSAFGNCTGLTSMVIPDSVTKIEAGAFGDCSSLTSLTLPFIGEKKIPSNDTSTYRQSFGALFSSYSFNGSTPVTQYESFMTDRNGSIINASKKTLYIPISLKSVTVTGGCIFYGAFENCTMLTNVTLGADVSYVEANAFKGCSNLTSVTFRNSSGWKRYSSYTATSGTNATLSNASNAAKYLTSTYVSYYWKRG